MWFVRNQTVIGLHQVVVAIGDVFVNKCTFSCVWAVLIRGTFWIPQTSFETSRNNFEIVTDYGEIENLAHALPRRISSLNSLDCLNAACDVSWTCDGLHETNDDDDYTAVEQDHWERLHSEPHDSTCQQNEIRVLKQLVQRCSINNGFP